MTKDRKSNEIVPLPQSAIEAIAPNMMQSSPAEFKANLMFNLAQYFGTNDVFIRNNKDLGTDEIEIKVEGHDNTYSCNIREVVSR